VPSLCRDFLLTVLNAGYYAVMTPALWDEWRRNQSGFALTWRRSMFARKRFIHLEPTDDSVLRSKIEACLTREADVQAARKDFHLVEAALATDRVIASLDETARGVFHAASVRVGELRRLVWVNPAETKDDCITWLANGAILERHRMLGFRDS
jgi:hypothetical protein